ncbi:tRNA glutamyl-Q(34) synthetase GluQRS [Nisaea sp.]|uniref:tRNA glutamyl-Q(34) synthetase GluQRS n=1 Tax=Nisaea sp. TaxID=2024842 RepID=UPI00326556C1
MLYRGRPVSLPHLLRYLYQEPCSAKLGGFALLSSLLFSDGTPPLTGTVTRFAPSPTGDLHLGHAYSALFAADQAERDGGTFLLRIEDIDVTRCRAEYEATNLDDLRWLGLSWAEPVRRQSEHFDFYRAAVDLLEEMGLLYRCFLSRRELNETLSAPHGAPAEAPTDTDKLLTEAERNRRLDSGAPFTLRLRMERALERTGALDWTDRQRGTQQARPEMFGDVVLARRDIPTSYHLAVILDDALQGITLVTRGEDLLEATHIHRLLQALLDLPTPDYQHHGLVRDEDGKRLAKREQSIAIRDLRAAGHSAGDVCAMARNQASD